MLYNYSSTLYFFSAEENHMIFTVSFKASRDRLRIGTSASFSAAWTILCKGHCLKQFGPKAAVPAQVKLMNLKEKLRYNR